MCRRVLELQRPVAGPRHDLAVADDHRPNRDLAAFPGLAGLLERQVHVSGREHRRFRWKGIAGAIPLLFACGFD